MTRIDIAEVQQFAHGIKVNNQEAKEHIQKTQIAIQNFVNDQSITGQAISSAKVYFSAAYFSLCQSIIQALNVSEHSLQQYIIDFHDQVDASPNAKLDMNNLMVLEDKIEKYESKKDQLLAEISNVSNAINGALGGSGQQDSLKIRGLTADITEAHKKERILEKYMDFERSHVGFSDELSDLAYAIQRTVADIKQNLTFNDKTGLFDVNDLHIDRFKKLHELYAKQKEIDDKVKELESIGLTPYIPSGNTAGFILNQDGTLNTDATLNQVNNQIIYWQNETGMRELFGIGAFYRAIYGVDAVSGKHISKGQQFMDGLAVVGMFGGPVFGVSKYTYDMDMLPMFRRSANIGAFVELSEPMQLKHVKQVCKEAGIDYSGIKIRIEKNPDLIGRKLYGYTDPKGKTVILYPDAFANREELIRTLGHERTHVMQFGLYGPAKDFETSRAFDKGAYKAEEDFWLYDRKMNGGK